MCTKMYFYNSFLLFILYRIWLYFIAYFIKYYYNTITKILIYINYYLLHRTVSYSFSTCFIKYYLIYYYLEKAMAPYSSTLPGKSHRNHQNILRVQVHIILGMTLANKTTFFFHKNVFSIISVKYNINMHFYSTLAYSLKKSRYICTCLLIK